jgi:hypothetical protein
MWCAVTAAQPAQVAGMLLLATAFTAVTIVSVAGLSEVELAHDDGGIARSVAFGTLLLTATLLTARHRPASRDVALRPGPTR